MACAVQAGHRPGSQLPLFHQEQRTLLFNTDALQNVCGLYILTFMLWREAASTLKTDPVIGEIVGQTSSTTRRCRR